MVAFGLFPSNRWLMTISFASAVRARTKRMGCEFMLVGPHFASSYNAFTWSSLTGSDENVLAVRA